MIPSKVESAWPSNHRTSPQDREQSNRVVSSCWPPRSPPPRSPPRVRRDGRRQRRRRGSQARGQLRTLLPRGSGAAAQPAHRRFGIVASGGEPLATRARGCCVEGWLVVRFARPRDAVVPGVGARVGAREGGSRSLAGSGAGGIGARLGSPRPGGCRVVTWAHAIPCTWPRAHLLHVVAGRRTRARRV